jgi:hypothetical protein
MVSVGGRVKNSLRRICGKKVYAYRGRIGHFISPSRIGDTIALKYHIIRSKNRSELHSATSRHVLFVTEKWYDGTPDGGPTNSVHNLFGSLEASGLSTQDTCHPDEYRLQNKRPFDTALLLKCIKSSVDLIVLTWPGTPELKTLKFIKERLQIPMVAIWWDSVNHMEEAESFLPFVVVNVTIDSATSHIGKTRQPEKYLPMWAPQDSRIYWNPGLQRDIDVSFTGTMAGHPDRIAGISALRSNGIEVYQTGGQNECRLSVDEYARMHMRSKIALNFCYHPNGVAQVKGRVFEVLLCGTMLLEAENVETARLFEPMIDYVPFSDEKDLVDKVRYYLDHDAEREEIAANGHQKAKEKYSGEIWWKIVFKRVFGTEF